MGFWRSFIHGETLSTAKVGPAFASSIDSGTLYGFASVDEAIKYLGAGGPVTRKVAIRVPAVKKARDLIAAGLGQLPLRLHDPAGTPVDGWALFVQPEVGRAPSVTWTWVADDLLFEARAILRVTHFGWHGKPAQVERVKPGTYSRGKGGIWVNRVGSPALWVPDAHLIEFESPNDGLLDAGARAIRILARLDAAAMNAVDGVPMVDYFVPSDANVDPFEDDDEAEEFLDSWAKARAARSTGYVPGGLEYKTNGFNPEQLQLAEARSFAIGEIARVTGVDAEELGLAVTSRTYFNAQDRRRHRSDNILGPYRVAIEGRASMDDVSPHGYAVRFDLSQAERSDDLTAAQTDAALITAQILTRDEVRARRGLPPLGEPARTPAPQEANA